MEINRLYEMALLSEASYANLELARNVDGSFDLTRTENALKDPNFNDMKFSDVQATEFITQWRVVEHQENTTSGFSATLFENIITGEKTLSIRGTEIGDVSDWYTDFVDIGVLGSTSSQDQYQDLKGFYQQLVTDGKLGANETFNVAGPEFVAGPGAMLGDVENIFLTGKRFLRAVWMVRGMKRFVNMSEMAGL